MKLNKAKENYEITNTMRLSALCILTALFANMGVIEMTIEIIAIEVNYFLLIKKIKKLLHLQTQIHYFTKTYSIKNFIYMLVHSQSSNMLNQARLKVLKVREDHVRNVLDEARKRLAEVPKDIKLYSDLLVTLIVQALFQLVEPTVTLRVRQADKALVESLLGRAQQDYKAKIKKDVVLKIDNENFLPPDTCGGIELIAAKGRIKISNTLESRLELIAQQLLPEIRNALFGRNPNRKFTD
ncbi:hypothetical protein O3G_MSEX010354 [Manduca sexta]|uniref:V-type proton ATPase subunit E n=1 Tax=Manduca sexta TaxID=7130 RepID=A0A922CTF8_MANSE|nr:hypothetical protein O3G_MSEX010354 [Manduca sexta]